MNYKDINKKFNALPEDIKKQVEEIIYDNKSIKKNKNSKSGNKLKRNKKSLLGLANGTIKIMPGFDEPVKELKEYFG